MISILKNIKELALTVSIVLGLGASLGWWKEAKNSDRLANNLYKKEIQWKDERGRMVTETTELKFTVEELQNVMAKDSATHYEKMSEMEKMLYDTGKEVEALKADADKLVSYHKAEIEAVYKDMKLNPIVIEGKLTHLDPIDTKNLKVNFNIEDGQVTADAKYNAEIVTIVDRSRDKFTKKGKKRFFLARLVKPRWQYSSKTVSDDIHASIVNDVQINFDNRK